ASADALIHRAGRKPLAALAGIREPGPDPLDRSGQKALEAQCIGRGQVAVATARDLVSVRMRVHVSLRLRDWGVFPATVLVATVFVATRSSARSSSSSLSRCRVQYFS